ncbi:hypothetical protein OKW21_003308 [Catalinimonas alkaloidigena]|uniref:hypothetical protein n=1 Tax=Catalinimonas alkaloidigena TaxID=1075417 RepID=UPI0024063CA5|nr:hypothetical protein [Catalinimonas alkaloidigena]MDF9798045.1 hypothetical protein [Catalinimonas alkaloidigena]
MRAKYFCSKVERVQNSLIAHLHGIQGIDTNDDVDNNQFNLSAPIGKLQIWIDNPKAEQFFIKGKEYYLDITKVDSETF